MAKTMCQGIVNSEIQFAIPAEKLDTSLKFVDLNKNKRILMCTN